MDREMYKDVRSCLKDFFDCSHTITVEAWLEKENPPLTTEFEAKSDSTDNKYYVQISLAHVRPLKGLTNENISAIYKDFLGMTMNLQLRNSAGLEEEQGRTHKIWREGDIEQMLSGFLWRVTGEAIAETANPTREYLGFDETDHLLREKPTFKLPRQDGTATEIFPDWAVINPANGNGPYTTADMVCEVKKSTVFDPELLECLQTIGGIDDSTWKRGSKTKFRWEEHLKKRNVVSPSQTFTNLVRCLKQTATYGWLAQNRHCIILTSKTVTFLRLFLVRQGEFPGDTLLGVEYASMPYENPGLTLSKSLWTATMMAQHEEHRKIVEEDEMTDLDVWHTYPDEDGEDGLCYFHHLSEIVSDVRPSIVDAQFVDIDLASDVIQRRFKMQYLKLQTESLLGVHGSTIEGLVSIATRSKRRNRRTRAGSMAALQFRLTHRSALKLVMNLVDALDDMTPLREKDMINGCTEIRKILRKMHDLT